MYKTIDERLNELTKERDYLVNEYNKLTEESQKILSRLIQIQAVIEELSKLKKELEKKEDINTQNNEQNNTQM